MRTKMWSSGSLIEPVLPVARNRIVKLTVDFADRGCSVLAESRELRGPDPVYSLSDRDLGVFAVADIAPENSSAALPAHSIASTPRSEEHTSELQSPCNLVCRLLLEKK